jgi:hypothetical protein
MSWGQVDAESLEGVFSIFWDCEKKYIVNPLFMYFQFIIKHLLALETVEVSYVTL